MAGGVEPCILLVRTVANRQTVVHACRKSFEHGVKIGMTLAHALALLPEEERDRACFEEHDAQRDHKALLKMAHWATRFAPLVAPDEHDHGLLMNVAGCARLYRGEAHLLKRVLHAVSELRITARAAIAPTYGAAWALARFGSSEVPIVTQVDALPAALAPLPVDALRLDDDMIDALEEVGVRTIGQLLAIPRAQLPSRFSHDLVLRIDQALGQAMETIAPVQHEEPVNISIEFAGPVKDVEVIQLAVVQLLDELCSRLQQCEGGVRRMVITFERYESESVDVVLVVSRPTRDAVHLRRLLEPRVENVNLGHGIEGIDMQARDWSRMPHEQGVHPSIDSQSIERKALDEEEGRLLDTLMHRLGHAQVSRIRCVESHLPERVMQLTAADEAVPSTPMSRVRHDRPTQVLQSPRPVDVQALTPDGPVMQIRWRGRWMRIMEATAPERLTAEWWHEANTSRDYFKVLLETGVSLWLFRESQSNRWFIHGRWT